MAVRGRVLSSYIIFSFQCKNVVVVNIIGFEVIVTSRGARTAIVLHTKFQNAKDLAWIYESNKTEQKNKHNVQASTAPNLMINTYAYVSSKIWL